jgi:hypothetical protein
LCLKAFLFDPAPGLKTIDCITAMSVECVKLPGTIDNENST